ncbi:class I SAM-dependent methyltransferase [Rhodocista pekingensis]|uniref:Class I SAM-dependent methyltransferase n=1 Tax=Rhodocista pekingensis TaxID=201185 RepID=A0ABW2KQZ1_9PROT
MSGARPPGPAQSWDADRYARDFGIVAELGRPVLDLLDPRPGERILDLGCGDGALTAELAARGVAVVAADADPDMVRAASARGLATRVVDGHDLPFQAEFDAVFSNAALHWMRDPDRVIAGVARALRPGGRFVAEMGGAGNVETVRNALVAALDARGLDGAAADPWFFPTVEDYAGRLARAGFAVRSITLIPRPTDLAAGMRAWLETFAGAFTARLPAAERGAFLDEVTAALAPVLHRPDGSWWADYVRLRFQAVKAGP